MHRNDSLSLSLSPHSCAFVRLCVCDLSCHSGFRGPHCDIKEYNVLYVVPGSGKLHYVLIASIIGALQVVIICVVVLCITRWVMLEHTHIQKQPTNEPGSSVFHVVCIWELQTPEHVGNSWKVTEVLGTHRKYCHVLRGHTHTHIWKPAGVYASTETHTYLYSPACTHTQTLVF